KTPLHITSEKGNYEATILLLNICNDIDKITAVTTPDANGNSPLLNAASSSNYKLLNYLINNYPVNFSDLKNNNQQTIIHLIANDIVNLESTIDILQTLLKRGFSD